MPASVTASPIRRYEYSDVGWTSLRFYYTKWDDNVKSILIELLDGTTVIDSVSVDVSSQALGSRLSYDVTFFNNGLSRISVSGAVDRAITIPSSGLDYTPSEGYDGLIVLSILPGVSVIDPNGVDLGNIDVYVPNGVTVRLQHTLGGDLQITVTEIPAGRVQSKTFTVRFTERDANGVALYQHTAEITDIPPISIGYEGEVTIYVIDAIPSGM